MSISLTLRAKIGRGNLHNSEAVANALERAAKRIRENGYVETAREGVYQITRAVLDDNGNEVGAFTLQDSPDGVVK